MTSKSTLRVSTETNNVNDENEWQRYSFIMAIVFKDVVNSFGARPRGTSFEIITPSLPLAFAPPLILTYATQPSLLNLPNRII